MLNNYMVIYENLPHKVRGFTIYNGCDDFYTIILNARLSYLSNLKTFAHELKHISNDDFIQYKNVAQIEHNAHI